MKPYEYMSEAELQQAVAEYIARRYPDVLFHSDFGSGVKLTPGQAMRQKRQNGGRKAWPDMFIAEVRTLACMFCHNGVTIPCTRPNFVPEERDGSKAYSGLFLELKKEGTRLKAVHCKPKDPRRGIDDEVYASAHLKEQADVLFRLRERGYCAEFAVGFEEAEKIIDEYLGGK